MITIASETQFGLVDLHERELEGITIVDKGGNLVQYNSTIHGTSFFL
jgi:hypothetical protein